jgi:hypothetical protein
MTRGSRRGGLAALLAGGLVAVAIVGPVVWDGLWLALAPAAALLIVTASALHAEWRPRDGRLGTVGSLVIAAAAAGLLALAVLGAAVTTDLGMEPRWLAFPEQVAGYALIAGALLFGAAALRTRRVPRWAAVAFAVSLPLGLGIDAAINAFPFGELFFFAGYGFYVGLGLFALSLMRIGLATRATPSDVDQGTDATPQW